MTISQACVIELANEYLSFSAAHFTVFGPEQRENLHGHNFRVRVLLELPVKADGLSVDYVALKRAVRSLCDSLDEKFLVPSRSPYIRVQLRDARYELVFAGASMSLPERDVLVLPLTNVTVETLSVYLVEQLLAHSLFASLGAKAIAVTVHSGPGQSGTSRWERP